MRAEEYLERLASRLRKRGLRCAARYAETPSRLLVWPWPYGKASEDVDPLVTESIYVSRGPDGLLWFRCSWGGCFARCTDLARAEAEVESLLEAYAEAWWERAELPTPGAMRRWVLRVASAPVRVLGGAAR